MIQMDICSLFVTFVSIYKYTYRFVLAGWLKVPYERYSYNVAHSARMCHELVMNTEHILEKAMAKWM